MRGAIDVRLSRLTAGTCFAIALLLMAAPSRAQFNGDPFDPFRAAYRSSSIPIAPQFAPGRPRMVTPPGMGSVPGIGIPWDAGFTTPAYPLPSVSRFERRDLDLLSPSNDVYRRYDEEFGRVYRPNAEADEQFSRLQEARRELYLQANRETDPQRKAELIRQYRDASRRISLGMSPESPSRSGRGASQSARQSDATSAEGLPRTVRSYDDLARWSRAINREAVAVGIVRPEGN